MIIRKTNLDDMPYLNEIYSHAREEMKRNGNLLQWKDIEPKEDRLLKYIRAGHHYIVLNDNKICAAFAMIPGEDPTYKYIDGKWLNDNPYLTIHCLASDNSIKGIFHLIMEYAFKFEKTIRIDTHQDNAIMLHLLKKNGFIFCGTIYLENEEPRLAFMKTLDL